MATYIGPELLEKIQNPLIFQDGSSGPKSGFTERYYGFVGWHWLVMHISLLNEYCR
jgi:hypothetical protein